MKESVAISVKNLSKTFKLPHEPESTIKSKILNPFRKRGYEKQEVLKNINFEIKKGEFFGIVGRNGSGKSTLLKLLAGIYSPDNGSIKVNGKLTPFIELGVGFNPELTGKENIFLNGALLGFTRNEMQKMYKEIVSFAELERFMDQKLKNYSSGMQVRLAFSIAIRANTDILVLDEVLAVGDERFQDKCIEYFKLLKKSGKTVVLVTHDMNSVKKFCDRSIVLDAGVKIFDGDSNKAALEYLRKNFPDQVSTDTGKAHESTDTKIEIINQNNKESVYSTGEKLKLRIKWRKKGVKNVGVAIYSTDGVYVFGANTILDKHDISGNQVTYTAELSLGSGRYYIQAALFGEDENNKIEFIDKAIEFSISAPHNWQGMTPLKHSWKEK